MKILMWDYNIEIKNSGGPSGYLYNIKTYITENNINKIVFLRDIINKENKPKHKTSFFQKIINCITKDYKQIRSWYTKYYIKDVDIEINKYDFIHFHSTKDLYIAQSNLKHYKGKIILTSHSPQPATEEMINGFSLIMQSLKGIYIHFLFKKEISIWDKADYIMFPVEGALEPYTKHKVFKEYYLKNKEKFIFCPTAILDNRNNHIDKNYFLKKIGIPNDSFIVTYIGRHNQIKGYDILKKIGQNILQQNKQVFFIIAGEEKPIKRLKNSNWKELGWINYGRDLINISDLFILPNRETYFDLIALEVLREGTPLLLTRTGGNKYFEQIYPKHKGLFYFETNPIDYNTISKTIHLLSNKNYLQECRESNRQLFLKNFEISTFVKRYLELINKL